MKTKVRLTQHVSEHRRGTRVSQFYLKLLTQACQLLCWVLQLHKLLKMLCQKVLSALVAVVAGSLAIVDICATEQ